MKQESLWGSRRGVSKVVGTVLLIAIVIALAATIGSMVSGFSDQLQEPAPQMAIDFEYDDDVTNSMEEYGVEPEGADADEVDELVIIQHQSGSTVDTSKLQLRMEATAADGGLITWEGTWAEAERTDDIAVAGNKFFFFVWNGATFENGTVEVVWRDGDSVNTILAEWNGPPTA